MRSSNRQKGNAVVQVCAWQSVCGLWSKIVFFVSELQSQIVDYTPNKT